MTTTNLPTTYDLLASHPFLEGMDRELLRRLVPWAAPSMFYAGARVFSEGGTANRFWLIRDGRVALDTYVPGHGEVVVETIGHGSVLGWSWLFAPYRWDLGATAVVPTLTVELDAAEVAALCTSDPLLGNELYRRFMAVVIDRLQTTRLRLLDLYGSRR